MEGQEFLKQQYISLREEIKETKTRIFKIAGFGIFVVPAAQYIAKAYQLDIIFIALPLLVIMVALLYLSENHALMRCGYYIKEHIEPKMIIGWEAWLAEKGRYDRRSVDKYLSYSFCLLFLIYYSGALYAVGRYALHEFGATAMLAMVGSYVVIGVTFIIYFYIHMKTCTTTVHEKK